MCFCGVTFTFIILLSKTKYIHISIHRYVWSWTEKDSIGHDSFHCQKYQNSKPFPTQRRIGPNNFVGSNICQNMTISSPCPVRCLPPDEGLTQFPSSGKSPQKHIAFQGREDPPEQVARCQA